MILPIINTLTILASTLLNTLPNALPFDPTVRLVLELQEFRQLFVLLLPLLLICLKRFRDLRRFATGPLAQPVSPERVRTANSSWRILSRLQRPALYLVHLEETHLDSCSKVRTDRFERLTLRESSWSEREPVFTGYYDDQTRSN